MKFKYVLIGALVSFSAFAFIRSSTSAGGVPTAATDGVNLYGVSACRVLVSVADSGTINSGTLQGYLYDSTAGWVRANTDQDCALESAAAKGLATVSAHTCSFRVFDRFGRFAMAASNLKGVDGGTPNGFGPDGGQNVEPVVKISCYGEGLSQ